MNSVAFFRTKAVQHAGARLYGTVLLARPISYSILTATSLIIVASVVAFLALCSYTRKAHVSGLLLPSLGLVKVIPKQEGTISAIYVAEGQVVKTGDVLFVLSNERASIQPGKSESTISSLLKSKRDSLIDDKSQSRLRSLQHIEAIRAKAEDLKTAIRQNQSQIKLQEQRVALAESTLQKYIDLQRSNYVSVIQVQARQGELIDQQQRLSDLLRAKASNRRDLSSAEAEMQEFHIQARRDEEAIQRDIAKVDQELIESEIKRDILVKAPRSGIIAALTANPGLSVSTRQSLAAIVPTGSPLEAVLYVPSKSIGFIRPGMNVLMRYQPYPYQKFGQSGGKITEISNTAMRTDDWITAGDFVPFEGSQDLLYRVKVQLDHQTLKTYGKEQHLTSGMRLEASILLDKRHLYEWMLDPLYAISGRL